VLVRATIGFGRQSRRGVLFLIGRATPASACNGERILFTQRQYLKKIAIALGRGKKLHDKRDTEKARDWNRDTSRLMRERG
jgi:hypothetical protein